LAGFNTIPSELLTIQYELTFWATLYVLGGVYVELFLHLRKHFGTGNCDVTRVLNARTLCRLKIRFEMFNHLSVEEDSNLLHERDP